MRSDEELVERAIDGHVPSIAAGYTFSPRIVNMSSIRP